MRELRAGVRRHLETQAGERYQSALAHYGTGSAATPDPHERPLGDFLAPDRPGRMADLVNAVTRDLRQDVAPWSVERILGMVALMVQQGRARDSDLS